MLNRVRKAEQCRRSESKDNRERARHTAGVHVAPAFAAVMPKLSLRETNPPERVPSR